MAKPPCPLRYRRDRAPTELARRSTVPALNLNAIIEDRAKWTTPNPRKNSAAPKTKKEIFIIYLALSKNLK